jgi:tetratricopeptide (TPR) repeat protein
MLVINPGRAPLPGASVSQIFKYRAFLSYGRADASIARLIGSRLEGFRIDRDLIGRLTRMGAVPEALGPIFRNRHDFLTRPTLARATTAALAESAAFIMLASPHSAQGKYVNKQARLFKALYPDRPVIVLIVEGAPDDPQAKRRPAALRFAMAPEWAGSPAEVLPPDLYLKGDELDIAIAKVVGRLIGVAPDELYRHDEGARRRRGRLYTAVAVAMTMLVIAGGIFSWKAYQNRLLRAEIAALVGKYRLVSPTPAAIPGAKESLTQAITAIGEGAAADPRYAKALELLEAGKATEAAPALGAVAQDKAKRGVKGTREAAAAYRTLAAVAALSDPGAARGYYTQAARFDPLDIESLYRSGWFQQQAGQLDAAEAFYGQVIGSTMIGSTRFRDGEWMLWAHLGRGDVARERGRLDEAVVAYRKAHAVAENLAKADPGNSDAEYNVAISHERIGDVLMAQGRAAEALKSYQLRQEILSRLASAFSGKAEVGREPEPADGKAIGGKALDAKATDAKAAGAPAAQDPLAEVLASHQVTLAIMDRLAKANLRNAGWQRDLAVSYDRVGNLLVWQDNLPDALKSYQASLGIVDRLARLDPGNVGWQRDVAQAYVRIGDVLGQQHNLADAMKSYQASLAVAERLAGADPGNARELGALAATYSKVGDVLVEQDNAPEALKSFAASLAIAQRLAKANPGNTPLQRELWATHSRIGSVLADQGNLAEALKSYSASLAIAQQLAKADPGNIALQSELSEMFDTVGDILKAQGNLAAAVNLYQASLAIAERLARADAGNAARLHDVAVTYSGIGDMFRVLGNLPEALKSYSASLAIAEQLASAESGNAGRWRDLAVAYSEVGDVLRARGDLTEALKSFSASLAIIGRVARGAPGNAGWQRDLSATHSGVGDVLMAQGNLRDALKSYAASLDIVERLAKAEPGNAAWQRDLSVTYVKLADFYRKSGKDTKAHKALAAARGIMARLVAQFPNQVRLKQDYAWFDPQTAIPKK